MGFISEIFGYVLNFLYELLNNYGLAIIIFSIMLRILLIPITIKQQKTMKKSAKLQEKTKALQFKYKNDPQKLNEETMKLYKEEKMSPFSGCLSGILQIIIILAVFWLVSQPLTYMKRINKDESLKNIVEEYRTEISSKNSGKKSAYVEIGIIAKIEEEYKQILIDIDNYDKYVERKQKEIEESKKEENTEIENNENEENIENNEVVENTESIENTENSENKEESKEEIKILSKEELEERKQNLEKLRINMDFLTLDLSMVPTQNLSNWKVYVIPVLYVITSFVSIKLSTKDLNKKKEEKKNNDKDINKDDENKEEKKTSEEELMDNMGQVSNSMNYMMPIMSISIAAIAPLGLALYWLVSNILIIFERLVINKLIKTKGEDENE